MISSLVSSWLPVGNETRQGEKVEKPSKSVGIASGSVRSGKKIENNHQEKKHEQSKKMSQTLTRGSSAIVIASACSAFSLRFVSTNVHMVFSHSGTGWYEK